MGRAASAALAAGLIAFALYRSTLLPGLDFGDTGSFQATVGERVITPRDGYPLYFAVGGLTWWLAGGEPAHALNLASAIAGAGAIALFTIVAAELSGSVAAATAAALLFAASYTFWSQAIIAEVYALHAVFVCLTLLLVLRWQHQPTIARLAVFFAAYAAAFGNHLSTILLLPGYTLFLLVAIPGGWRRLVAPRTVALASVCAAAGALQYAWNLHGLWVSATPPHGISDALRTFWFDVTKSDWRETMVMRVPESVVGDRLAMYWFDLRQQFGWAIAPLAIAGVYRLTVVDWRRAVLMLTLYAVNVGFAFTYNVGDAHVFYIPSHLLLALLASCGIVAAATTVRSPRAVAVASVAALLYAGARMYRDYPALDRSNDRRPEQLLAALTGGLDDTSDILLSDVNWQLDNGLAYYTKVIRPQVAIAHMLDVLPFLPALLGDNEAVGRRVAVTARARDDAAAAYAPLLVVEPDPRVVTRSLRAIVDRLPRGSRYVLAVLKPTREHTFDAGEFAAVTHTLTGGRPLALPAAAYFAIAGLVGQPPALLRDEPRPWAADATVDGTRLTIRMESWLAADTIRRMGFGHAIAGRRHTLVLERGVSFAAFDGDGRALVTAYAAGIFEPQPRYLVRLAR